MALNSKIFFCDVMKAFVQMQNVHELSGGRLGMGFYKTGQESELVVAFLAYVTQA